MGSNHGVPEDFYRKHEIVCSSRNEGKLRNCHPAVAELLFTSKPVTALWHAPLRFCRVCIVGRVGPILSISHELNVHFGSTVKVLTIRNAHVTSSVPRMSHYRSECSCWLQTCCRTDSMWQVLNTTGSATVLIFFEPRGHHCLVVRSGGFWSMLRVVQCTQFGSDLERPTKRGTKE